MLLKFNKRKKWFQNLKWIYKKSYSTLPEKTVWDFFCEGSYGEWFRGACGYWEKWRLYGEKAEECTAKANSLDKVLSAFLANLLLSLRNISSVRSVKIFFLNLFSLLFFSSGIFTSQRSLTAPDYFFPSLFTYFLPFICFLLFVYHECITTALFTLFIPTTPSPYPIPLLLSETLKPSYTRRYKMLRSFFSEDCRSCPELTGDTYRVLEDSLLFLCK